MALLEQTRSVIEFSEGAAWIYSQYLVKHEWDQEQIWGISIRHY